MAISSPEMMLVPARYQCAVTLPVLQGILTKVDVTEATAANLAADAVFVPHAEILRSVSPVVASRHVSGIALRSHVEQAATEYVVGVVEGADGVHTIVVMVGFDLRREDLR